MNTKDVASYLVKSSFTQLPSDVIAEAKTCILDILGVSIAANDAKSVNCVRKVVEAMGGKGEATLLGTGVKYPTPLVAWANSVLASALDFDDGNFWAYGHAGHHGALVVPTSFCIAESEDLTGKDLLEAIVIGYEVGIRSGYILSSIMEGSNPAGAMGCYGATAVAAKLLRLNEENTIQALNIVDSHSPVRRRGVPSGGSMRGVMTKEEIGWAVLSGVTAALLAREGFTGPYSIFDDSRFDQSLQSSFGKEYEILKVYHKPHAACLLVHAALDGVFDLTQKHNITAKNVAEVTVASSSIAIMLNSYRPDSIEQAAYGMPFLIGAAIVDGKVGPEQVNDARLEDKAILEVADKVKVEVDPQVEALGVAGELGAVVKIKTKDGKTYETRVDRGRVLTSNEVVEKFRTISTGPLGRDRVEEVISCVNNLENLKSTRELINLIAKF